MSIEDPNEVPEVWRPHFAAQRIEFTFRDLDRNVPGVALNTIRRALLGIGTPSRRVASAIAGGLGISEEEFNATRAKVTGDTPTAPFTLPTSADLLNQRERDAVLSVVHALLDARDRHAEPSATPADHPPAEEPRTPGEEDEDEKTIPASHVEQLFIEVVTRARAHQAAGTPPDWAWADFIQTMSDRLNLNADKINKMVEDKPADLNPEDQGSNVEPLRPRRRRGRDFDADPIIEADAAAYDPDGPTEEERREDEEDAGQGEADQ